MTNDSRLPFTMLLPDDARLPIEIHDHSVALRLGVVERGAANLLDESWDRPGAFILLGTVHGDGSFDVHVGSTPTGMRARLVVMENTRTWTRALLVQRDAQQGLTASHAGWLEGDLEELFRTSPKARLAPGQRVSDTSVASYYLPILASFREPITRVLRLLGYDPRPGTGRLAPAIPSLTAALPPGPSSSSPRPSGASGSSSMPSSPMPSPSMPGTSGPSTSRPGSPSSDPYRDYPGSATRPGQSYPPPTSRPGQSYPPSTSRPAPAYAPAASAQPRDPRPGHDVLERVGADTPLAARVRAEHLGQLPAAPSRQIGSPHAPMSVPSFPSSDSGPGRTSGGGAPRGSSPLGSNDYTGSFPTSYSPGSSGSPSGSSYSGGSTSGSTRPGGSGATSSYGSGSGSASGSTYPPRPPSPSFGGGSGSSHGSGPGSSYSPSGLRPASYSGSAPSGAPGSGSGAGQSGPGNALAPRPSMPLLRFGREASPIFDAMRSPEERRR